MNIPRGNLREVTETDINVQRLVYYDVEQAISNHLISLNNDLDYYVGKDLRTHISRNTWHPIRQTLSQIEFNIQQTI